MFQRSQGSKSSPRTISASGEKLTSSSKKTPKSILTGIGKSAKGAPLTLSQYFGGSDVEDANESVGSSDDESSNAPAVFLEDLETYKTQ